MSRILLIKVHQAEGLHLVAERLRRADGLPRIKEGFARLILRHVSGSFGILSMFVGNVVFAIDVSFVSLFRCRAVFINSFRCVGLCPGC